jgi:hypothetical protein
VTYGPPLPEFSDASIHTGKTRNPTSHRCVDMRPPLPEAECRIRRLRHHQPAEESEDRTKRLTHGIDYPGKDSSETGGYTLLPALRR